MAIQIHTTEAKAIECKLVTHTVHTKPDVGYQNFVA
jgi:hypothetical protein